MSIKGIEEIQQTLLRIEQRIATNISEFETLLGSSPFVSLGLIERIAADRGRQVRLALLLHALSGDWEDWAAQTMDERMRGACFLRVSPHQPLYLRRRYGTNPCIELCDRFSSIRIEPQVLAPLIADLQRWHVYISPAAYGRERIPAMN